METDHQCFTWSPDDKLTKINLKFLALNSYGSGILLHGIVMNKPTDLCVPFWTLVRWCTITQVYYGIYVK